MSKNWGDYQSNIMQFAADSPFLTVNKRIYNMHTSKQNMSYWS